MVGDSKFQGATPVYYDIPENRVQLLKLVL